MNCPHCGQDLDGQSLGSHIGQGICSETEAETRGMTNAERREHKQPLLDILYECGRVHASRLYEVYGKRAEKPVGRATARQYLYDLADRDLVDVTGESYKRHYAPGDHLQLRADTDGRVRA